MTGLGVPALLKLCAAVYLIALVAEWWTAHNGRRLLWQLLVLAGLLGLEVVLASREAGYLTFGPDGGSVTTVLAMFGAIVLGIAAHYVFYLRGRFRWLEFVKPLCISPILLLPLIASLQSVRSLQPMQMVSFALLAFQNGFFWQAVLQQARPRAGGVGPAK